MKWKFQLGDFVTPVVHHKSEHATKMVVVAKVVEEYADHTKQSYICSHYKLGDYVRQQLMEAELEAYAVA